MTPNSLSELIVKADTPYDTRDKCKLIQPLKRASTYGLRSLQYNGAHVRNILPFLLWTLHLSVCFIYLYLTIVHVAYLFIYALKSGTSDLSVQILFVLHCTNYKWYLLTLTLTECETKWPPVCRRHFQMHFLERKFISFLSESTAICS